MGRRIAESGHTLVYGGGDVGLMGAVANAALAAGGEVVGVITPYLGLCLDSTRFAAETVRVS